LTSARLIIMTIGRTAGLRWEVERISELGLWSKVVLLFPPVPEEELARRWRNFREGTVQGMRELALPLASTGALTAVVTTAPAATFYGGARRDEWGYGAALEAALQALSVAPMPWRLRPATARRWTPATVIPPSSTGTPVGRGMAPGRQFYVFVSNRVMGPYGLTQLRAMAANHQIGSYTPVWTAPGPWVPGGEVPGIFSDKSWETALLLSAFGGLFGIDRFYLGYVAAGIGKLLTVGLCGVWWLVDVVFIAMRRIPDGRGRPLR
jgi:hypothetical protein